MALSSAWPSWQAVLNISHISIKLKKNKIKNFNRPAISWQLLKQAGVLASPMHSASVAFLRVRRINIEINFLKITFDHGHHRNEFLSVHSTMARIGYKLLETSSILLTAFGDSFDFEQVLKRHYFTPS